MALPASFYPTSLSFRLKALLCFICPHFFTLLFVPPVAPNNCHPCFSGHVEISIASILLVEPVAILNVASAALYCETEIPEAERD